MPAMKKLRIASLLSLLVLFPGASLFSQSGPPKPAPEFDHTAVHVRDLEKSAEFYEKVMGLERIPEPFKDGKHVWYRIGAHDQLHVISGATAAVQQEIGIHFAFRVASLSDFTAHLDNMHVKYGSYDGKERVTLRPDGVKQIYLQDPDGYWIEVNDGK
jgi:lactoylglutathione lyase